MLCATLHHLCSTDEDTEAHLLGHMPQMKLRTEAIGAQAADSLVHYAPLADSGQEWVRTVWRCSYISHA